METERAGNLRTQNLDGKRVFTGIPESGEHMRIAILLFDHQQHVYSPSVAKRVCTSSAA
jgi:TRAP-type uncharacterized transport system substrate-binding protein